MSLSRILPDCEPLKDRNSGFSHFVVPLAHELLRYNTRYPLYCYVPPREVGGLGRLGVRYLTQRSFHKYFNPASYGLRLWHATSQLSWYVPARPVTKVVLTVHDFIFLHENPDERTYTRQLARVRRNTRRADYLVTISDFVRHADLLGYTVRQPLRYVPRDVDAPWYYQHCLAYLPLLLAAGCGLPVVEAMQLGKPVLLSRLTSLPEVGGAAAYYFDDFSPQHLRQALAAGLARHTPARAAEAQARQFSWAQAAADYLTIYQELLGR